MVTYLYTFTVATMINQALSNVRIKTEIKTVAQVYTRREEYNYMTPEMTVKKIFKIWLNGLTLFVFLLCLRMIGLLGL